MTTKTSAAEFLPKQRTLKSLRAAACSCKGCELYEAANQTVFGEGPEASSLMLIGEQPGDLEDRQGRPFVGPAGRMLDKALGAARIAREEVYVTNAVKHFRWIQRGKRRLHQKPLIRQVIACQPWLHAELDVIQPKLIVCLGAVAAQSLLGRSVSVTKERGTFFDSDSGAKVFVTIHPSAIYRQRDKSAQQKEYRRFLSDIKQVERKLHRMVR